MLFRNLKSGNIVDVRDDLTESLMQRSELYERIEEPKTNKKKPPVKGGKSSV